VAILDRSSLEQSPLADLHAIASELSIDGYRRLRKAELIDTILERQGGEGGGSAAASEEEPEAERPAPRRRGRRRKAESPPDAETESDAREEGPEETERKPEREPQRSGDGRRGRGRQREERQGDGRKGEERQGDERERDEPVEGVVELLPNGSGFVRVNPPEPSDEDVYISSAQVRRCELVTGDRVGGPRRAPRRSERFAALVRIDTINGRPAAELSDGARYDDLPASFPSEAIALDAAEDPTVQAIPPVAPIGRGSRVTITGQAQSGKTELLRRLATVIAANEDLQLWLVLVGVRPEEVAEWRKGSLEPAVALSLSASADAQAQALEGTVEQARRIAARGAHAVVMIDTLAGLPAQAGAKALAAARNLGNGSLTVIATASEPLGGETTVIALDRALARAGRFPALDPDASWTMRSELLSATAG
jgi:transcription termination factor Rho